MITLPVRNPLALLAAAAFALALVLGPAPAAGGVQAQGTGGAVSLSIEGPGVDCDGDECIVEPGSSFTLIVSVSEAPEPGYLGIGTQTLFRNLIYSPTDQAVEEIVVDVDNFPGIAVRAPSDPTVSGEVDHGMTAGTPPTFTTSHYEGPILELAMTCTDDYSRNDVELGAYSPTNTLGTGFKLPNDENVSAGDILLIHCGTPPAGSGGTATPTSLPPGAGTPFPPDSPEAQATATAEAAAAAVAATATASAGATATAVAEGGDGGDDDGGSNTGLWIALGAIAGVAVLLGGGYLAWRRFGAPGGGAPGGAGGGAGPAGTGGAGTAGDA